MSAIGSCVRMKSADFDRCLRLAEQVRSETTGRWLWKKTVQVGAAEFNVAWDSSVVEEVEFDHSGYALSDYFNAQEAVNGYSKDPFDSSEGEVLGKVFTAAFPVRSRTTTFPVLSEPPLRKFCEMEYGEDVESMFTAIKSADQFYRRGIASILPDEVVVFVIA